MRLRLGLLLLFLAVLETTVVPFFRVGGIAPDLILLEVVALALYRGPLPGAIFGMLGGAFLDLWHGEALGLFTLAGGATGYLFGLLEPRLFKDNLLVPLIAGFSGTLLFQLMFLLSGSFAGSSFLLWPALTGVVLPEAVYNAVLAPLIFRITANLLRSGGIATVVGKDTSK